MSEPPGKWFAWAALLLCGAAVLLFQQGSLGFLPGHHGYNTSLGLALAKNLGPESSFLMYSQVSIDASGRKVFRPHNRLPILSFAAIKGAMLPFGGKIHSEMRAAHLLMNLFFVGAIVVAYRLGLALTSKPLVALAAALLAFSSSYAQYFNDMVFNDIPALFGFLLVFLAIVAVRKTGRWGLSAAAAVVAVGMGWQVFGVLVCWWLLEAAISLKEMRQGAARWSLGMLRNPATLTLGIAVLWGGALLAFNLLNESKALHQDIASLPSTRSILFRLGVEGGADAFPQLEELRWGDFLQAQARRVVKAAVPTRPIHELLDHTVERAGGRGGFGLLLILGPIAVTLLYFLRGLLRQSPDPVALLVVLLSGFFWVIPMRNFTAFHDYQSLFYVGAVLVGYLALLHRAPPRASWAAAVLAMALFVYANVDMNRRKAEEGKHFEAYTRDFERISEQIGGGKNLQVGADADEFADEMKRLRYYLAGSCFSDEAHAQYVLTRNRSWQDRTLTPLNEVIFLFPKPAEHSPTSPLYPGITRRNDPISDQWDSTSLLRSARFP